MLLRVAGSILCVSSLLDRVAASSSQCSSELMPGAQPNGDALMQVAKRQTVESLGSSAARSRAIDDTFTVFNGSLEQPPSGDLAITVSGIKCNTAIYAPDGTCPIACPYFAQEGAPGRACYFQCVKAEQCGSLNPKEDIADRELMICRTCRVVGCKKCAKGKGDMCGECDRGYTLSTSDGSCTNDYWKVWTTIFTIVGVLALVLVVWMVRLVMLPVTNEAGLKEGLAYRSGLKLRVPSSLAHLVGTDPSRNERPLWPLTTSLHGVQVAGSGTLLHMNFQVALIMWGSIVIVAWVIYAYFTSPDMLVLGLYPAETPQQVCSVTLRGKELQRRLLPTKLIFMIVLFVMTCLFNFLYALYQRHKFLEIDDETSMTDYAALCVGLPHMDGDTKSEELIKKCIEEATGETVVGVSVCWNYKDVEDEVNEAIDNEIELMEDYPSPPSQLEVDAQKGGFGQKIFGSIDFAFGFTGKVSEDVSAATEKADVEKMLHTISSTDSAFIVFESEASRDSAVKKSRSTCIVFQERTLTLSHDEAYEPDTVKWTNFNVGNVQFYSKIAIGIVAIFFALVIWGLGFYLPFAAYQASFAEQGEEPGFLAAFVFSMLVVVGNQIMYFLCAEISDRVGFRFNDHQEAFYITIYTLACTLNLAVDMYMEFYLAYEAAVAANVRTADGKEIQSLNGFQEIFESYPMQKAVGTRLFAYCFPATFFIPFVMEPIFAIVVPFYICKWLLRTHPECRGREAEKSMEFFAPMDMGRYGDLILNLWLSVLIVFFPPGTFLKMMLALVVSHVFVYFYDTYRILRSVPGFDYSSDYIDRLVQWLMGFASAFLAAGIVFKGGCVEGSGVCLKQYRLGGAMMCAFVITMLFHTILIKAIVPMFDNITHSEHRVTETPYSEAAASLPSTWFSENRVHCLRTKYIYKHDPPCIFNTRGKEHLIKQNTKCGVYYRQASRVSFDEYD